jgi:acetyl-CoA carboxylase biotin carboxyl carrier protein
MEFKDIQKLIEFIEQSSIDEFEIEDNGKSTKLIIKKNKVASVTTQSAIIEKHLETLHDSSLEKTTKSIDETKKQIETPVKETKSNLYEQKSPIVGTFYRAPSPDADPFIEVGSFVKKGATLCIIEAMKIMNEIEADISGKIVKILVDNAQAVEYGDILLHIEPSV